VLVLVQVIFMLSPPGQLTDIFNYINYARMDVVHGLNPYTTIPALAPSTDPTYLLSNWHGLLSPYGPLFTLFTLAIVPLGVAGAYWAIKLALVVLSLGIIWLVWHCAELLGRKPLTAALFVGLNPIVLVWGLGGDHNDFFMVFAIVLAVYLLLRAESARVGLRARGVDAAEHTRTTAMAIFRRAFAWLDGTPRPLPIGEPGPWLEVGAGSALAAAVAIKASAAILVPVMIFGAPRRARFAIGVLLGLLVFGAATVAAFGFNLPDLAQQDGLVVQGGIPNVLGYILGSGGETTGLHSVLTEVLVVSVVGATLWAMRTRRWITASGFAIVALLVTLSWMLPSYVLWLLPFAALARRRWLRVIALVFGLYIFLLWMPYSADLENFLHLRLGSTPLAHELAILQHALEY
jgi:alpha-1,6-mannosyltransferase